jgi:uncharacterized membrane protein YdbT with pleckstrin-like domain
MKFLQRLLADDERLVLVLRRHVKVLLLPITVCVLVAALLGSSFLIPAGARPWSWMVLGAIGVVALVRWTLWPLVVWANTIYAVTTRRLIIRTGVLNRSGHDLPLSRLNDVSFSQSLLERMLGCGTLVVESASEHGQLKLADIPKVELVQQTLHRLSDDLLGVSGAGTVDPGLARSLDDVFDDAYRGPAGATERGLDERRS